MSKKRTNEAVQAFFDAVAWVDNPDMVEKPDVVREYLANGGDVNVQRENGETALFSAAMDGSAEMVQLLLGAGAEVNIRCSWGGTPLARAAMGGNLSAVQLLLGAGAHVNVLSYESSETPLQSAYTEAYLLYEEVNREAVACVEYLEAHGAKWNLVLDCEDMPELSPLNYRFLRAVVQEDTEAVYAALAEGANVNVRGHGSVSALEQAVAYDNVALIRALFCYEPDAESVQAAVDTAERYGCRRALAALL